MRPRVLVCSALFEVLGRGLSGKSAVRPVVFVEVLEAVENGVEGLDRARQAVASVELVAP